MPFVGEEGHEARLRASRRSVRVPVRRLSIAIADAAPARGAEAPRQSLCLMLESAATASTLPLVIRARTRHAACAVLRNR